MARAAKADRPAGDTTTAPSETPRVAGTPAGGRLRRRDIDRLNHPSTGPRPPHAEITEASGFSQHDGEPRRDHLRPPRTTSATLHRAGSWSHGEYKRNGDLPLTWTPLKRRHEARAGRQSSGSQPPASEQHGTRRAHTQTTDLPVVAPRSPYGRSCRRCVTIIQSGHRTTTILKVAATHQRSRGSKKGTPGQRHLCQALRSHKDPPRHSPTHQQEGRDQRQPNKPYARSGRNACRGDPEAFTAGNEKGQLSWPFTKSG
jgi:hypothetical protein